MKKFAALCTVLGVILCYPKFHANDPAKSFEPSKIQKRYDNDSQPQTEPTLSDFDVICLDSEQTINNDYADYHFSCDAKITNVLCEESAQLANWVCNESEVTCRLSGFIANSKIKIDFYSSETLIDTVTLYFVVDASGLFHSSGVSLDTAKRDAGIALDYDLIDEAEELAEDSIHHPIAARAPSTSGVVSGKFEWKDDQELIHPLVGARVKLRIAGSNWDLTTFTNDSGEYSFEYVDVKYSGSGKPKITLYTDDKATIKVTKNGTYAKTHEFQTVGGNNSYSYMFSPTNDGDMGKAIMIFQAAKLYSNHVMELNDGTAISKCSFVYPAKKSVCQYSNNVVYIVGEEPRYPYLPNSYASWDMIGHEYAHHIQNYFDIADSPGGAHTNGSNLLDQLYKTNKYTLTQAKDRALRLSWGEGWATYWSIVAQQSFPDEFKTIRTVGNTDYSAYNGVDYKLDVYIDRSNGESSELAELLIECF